MYLLESPRGGESNKYTKLFFSEEQNGNINEKNTRSADLVQTQLTLQRI